MQVSLLWDDFPTLYGTLHGYIDTTIAMSDRSPGRQRRSPQATQLIFPDQPVLSCIRAFGNAIIARSRWAPNKIFYSNTKMLRRGFFAFAAVRDIAAP